MSRNLRMAMVMIMVCLATTGVAQARGANLREPRPWTRPQKQSLSRPDYARELVPWDIPGRGLVYLNEQEIDNV